MLPENWLRAKELLADALERGPDERDAYLKQACDGDDALYAQVMELLAAHEAAGTFLIGTDDTRTERKGSGEETPGEPLEPVGPAAGDAQASLPADGAFPGYTILRELHRGGQGVVYLAVQRSTKRKVALKAMLEGPFAGSASKRRFEREIELVGSLRHPGIVPIFDSGAAQGRFYYAMEYIRGEPLVEYVQRHELSADETLRVFHEVCQAVDYAHQKGVIHRDLKPSNILVDESRHPHVLDFGLAKIGGAEADDERTLVVSVTGQVMGTLAYMSPEQAAGRPDQVDMRSDVYALGVILYELLTERLPYDLSGSMAENLTTIQQAEPRRPSTIRRQINDEVETIILKALSKERQRRYSTAGNLGDEIQRFLAGEPIEAKRDSAFYLVKKLMRRYRVPVTIAAVLFVVISTALLASLTFWRRAAFQRDLADDRLVEITAAQEEAERAREAMRRLLYVSDINVALQAWDSANVRRVVELLKRHHPREGEPDLRGFEWYYLWERCRRGMMTPTLHHPTNVTIAAFSLDGTVLATGGMDNIIRLWSVADHNVLWTLKGHTGFLISLVFSPDGRLLASGGGDRSVKLWNVVDGALVATLSDHTLQIWSLAFSPDGRMLASASIDGTIKLWDVGTRMRQRTVAAHEGGAWAVAFAPDGMTFASGGADGKMRIWNVDTGEAQTTLDAHAGTVWCVAFSPDGSRLASGGSDQIVKLWDPDTGEQLSTLEGHTNTVVSVAFSPDGKTLASGNEDNTVRLWDVGRSALREPLIGHSGPVWSVAFSPNGEMLASGAADQTAKLWGVRRPRPPDTLAVEVGDSPDVTFSPVADQLAVISGESRVEFWEPATGTLLRTLQAGDARLTSIAYSADGHLFAAGTRSGKVILWDLKNRNGPRILTGHTGQVRSVAFSPDGSRLASGSGDGTVRLWHVSTGAEAGTLTQHAAGIRVVSFSPDGAFLVSTSLDRTARLWDAESSELKATLEGHLGAVWSAAFSPDGKTLATGSYDATIILWDVATAKPKHRLRGHSNAVACLVFSPDGSRLVSGSHDHTLKLWDPIRGEERCTFKAHTSAVYSVAFSRDGRTMATGGGDRVVRLWRAASRDAVANAGPWWRP